MSPPTNNWITWFSLIIWFIEILCDRNEEQCTEKRLTALILLKEEFAVVQAYRQHLSAELIIKDPRWYEQHIYETVCHMTNVTSEIWIFEGIFVDFRLTNNIFFNKTESFVGRNTSNHACQIFCSKSNCETMYHWFFLQEITVVKQMNYLNVCSAHSYLYPRFKQLFIPYN